jgi:hypothetical protein
VSTARERNDTKRKHTRDVLRVCSRASTTAPDVGRHVVNLLTVFVRNLQGKRVSKRRQCSRTNQYEYEHRRTVSPLVARVSAPSTTPSCYKPNSAAPATPPTLTQTAPYLVRDAHNGCTRLFHAWHACRLAQHELVAAHGPTTFQTSRRRPGSAPRI